MTTIDEITAKIKTGLYEFSKHAADQSIFRRIRVSEIEQAMDNGQWGVAYSM